MATELVTRASAEGAAQPRLWDWRWPSWNFTGLAFAVVFFWWSMTPSLLPRTWQFQGVVSGIATAAAYGLGVLASHGVRTLPHPEPSPAVKRAAWRALALAGLGVVSGFLYFGATWQARIHGLMELEQPPSFSYIGTVALTTALFVALVGIGRGLRRLTRRVARGLSRWVPQRAAGAVSTILVALLLVGLLDGIVLRAFFNSADGVFSAADQVIAEDILPPVSSLRSGGPGSATPWDTLGSRGREFIASGPDAAALDAFSARPAFEPIRIYVGLHAADTTREQAAIAVQELERAGAFDRAVLGVFTATGTGKINLKAAAAVEYLHNGDTALASIQYSYLPSSLSFLVDSGRARDAGSELFNQVYDRWAELPEDQRPLLLVYGESLGAHGSAAAFSGLADIRNRTDGVLWVGPPNFKDLWRELVAHRDPSTPERLPTYDGGEMVRFAASPADLTRHGVNWPPPRVVYLQHASDPVVWWSTSLLHRQPDWAREPRGEDVLPTVRWYPFVTFWQVTADMANANAVPDGHGHHYGLEIADAWAAIVPPPGWTPEDTARLRLVLAD